MMKDSIETGGQAFPSVKYNREFEQYFTKGGMTLRQYAAIKLKVPNSGTDWLDEMIRESLRDEFAAKAMAALIQSGCLGEDGDIAEAAYEVADAMLKTRERDTA